MRNRILLVVFFIFTYLANVFAQQSGSLKGIVLDARSGEPLAKVKVIVNGTDLIANTNDKGEFTVENIPIGSVDLYITTVNYGLVKKSLLIKAGTNEARIILNEDAAALTESV